MKRQLDTTPAPAMIPRAECEKQIYPIAVVPIFDYCYVMEKLNLKKFAAMKLINSSVHHGVLVVNSPGKFKLAPIEEPLFLFSRSETRKCDSCGAPFHPKMPNQRYCDGKCYHRENMKQHQQREKRIKKVIPCEECGEMRWNKFHWKKNGEQGRCLTCHSETTNNAMKEIFNEDREFKRESGRRTLKRR